MIMRKISLYESSRSKKEARKNMTVHIAKNKNSGSRLFKFLFIFLRCSVSMLWI